MALSSKIAQVYIRDLNFSSGDATEKYRFTTNNFVSELGQVNFSGAFDEAIDASLRSNFRGFRLNVSLNWQKLHDSTVESTQNDSTYSAAKVGDFLEWLRTMLVTDGDSYVEISFNDGAGDSDTTPTPNWFKVIPDSLNYKTTYTNQIGRGSASLDFIGQEIITTVPSTLEAPSV